MFEKLGHFAVRRRKLAVLAFVIATLVAGGVGSQVFNRLDSGGYSISSSDSYKVYDYIKNTLKQSDPTIVLMVDAGKSVDDPAIAAGQLSSAPVLPTSLFYLPPAVAIVPGADSSRPVSGIYCAVSFEWMCRQ